MDSAAALPRTCPVHARTSLSTCGRCGVFQCAMCWEVGQPRDVCKACREKQPKPKWVSQAAILSTAAYVLSFIAMVLMNLTVRVQLPLDAWALVRLAAPIGVAVAAAIFAVMAYQSPEAASERSRRVAASAFLASAVAVGFTAYRLWGVWQLIG